MKTLILLVALCTYAAAMVPRQRRAMADEQAPTSTVRPICYAKTPCGWIFYKDIEYYHNRWERTNDYCECAANLTCQEDENDTVGKSIIKRCKTPPPSTETPPSTESES